MELLNLWVVSVLLTFTDIPAYESHYQKVTFNNEDSCNEFLEEQRMNLAHDLIHIFEQTDKNLKGIKLTCQILKGDEV